MPSTANNATFRLGESRVCLFSLPSAKNALLRSPLYSRLIGTLQEVQFSGDAPTPNKGVKNTIGCDCFSPFADFFKKQCLQIAKVGKRADYCKKSHGFLRNDEYRLLADGKQTR